MIASAVQKRKVEDAMMGGVGYTDELATLLDSKNQDTKYDREVEKIR